jgi:pyocin large subunit-like protein
MSKPAASTDVASVRRMAEHWAALQLAPTARHVLHVVNLFADWGTGLNASPSVLTVARLTGYSRSTVQRIIADLLASGALVRTRQGSGHERSVYRVVRPSERAGEGPHYRASEVSARGP